MVALVSLLLLLPNSILVPVLPLEVQHRRLHQFISGIIFSLLAIAWLAVPSIVTKNLLHRLG